MTKDSQESSALISLRDITKAYGIGQARTYALHGVDLDIARGDFVSIMGPSGSGKSTCMNILGCLDTPTRGTYHLGGTEVSTLSDDELAQIRNREIGFVFQTFNLLARANALVVVPEPAARLDAGTDGNITAAHFKDPQGNEYKAVGK